MFVSPTPVEIRRRAHGLSRSPDRFQRQNQVTRPLIERLRLERELQGHEGCVNCLEWSDDGSCLATGSDDQGIILWDPFRGIQRKNFYSGHRGNIFSVKFLPQSNDSTIISGAADFRVRVHYLGGTGNEDWACSCHMGRVKRIATVPGEASLFWSGSEDGTVIQHDLRCQHFCSRPCNRNVVLNLANHVGRQAEIKCVAINALRPEQLAVGANDAFVRIYDRRKLPLTSTSGAHETEGSGSQHENRTSGASSTGRESDLTVPDCDNLTRGCVQYFVPGHIPMHSRSDPGLRYRSLATTYVAFNPNDGNQLLANIGGEQVYLFDVVNRRKPVLLDGSVQHSVPHMCPMEASSLPPAIQELKLRANKELQGNAPSRALVLYTQAILKSPNSCILYFNRATAFAKRNWEGDQYAALRDCLTALALYPGHMKAHFRLIKTLHSLGCHRDALWAHRLFQRRFKEQRNSPESKAVKRDIMTALKRESLNGGRRRDGQNGKRREGTREEYRFKADQWRKLILEEGEDGALTESDSENEEMDDSNGPSRRGDHAMEDDTPQETTTTAETEAKTDEGPKEETASAATERDGEANDPGDGSSGEQRGRVGPSMFLRRRRRRAVPAGAEDDTSPPPTSRRLEMLFSAFEKEWRRTASDFDMRFCGHCNTTTDIKEANFFGENFIVAGSDDGRFFIWDKSTGEIVRVMTGDESIVNCLQPHPNTCLLATSGIESVVRIWSPMVAELKPESEERTVENVEQVASENQTRMRSSPMEVMFLNMAYRLPYQPSDEEGDGDERPPAVQCRAS
ncbi:unnamed protein product [Cyprideis torosa]|uniref:Uncharacterized protein n=1 Tax=Cyprideis torosa TaxID=163714 RepID=A0A7R8W8J8_9CRUS|nr:unnamed protein product [Cyprideis torosa]CAG0884379.1 unnamed protein product [Cyprideis torosa]